MLALVILAKELSMARAEVVVEVFLLLTAGAMITASFKARTMLMLGNVFGTRSLKLRVELSWRLFSAGDERARVGSRVLWRRSRVKLLLFTP